MIKPIVRDMTFLSKKSEPVTREDVYIGRDLIDTLRAHQEECVGMAANMIGYKKRMIIANVGIMNLVMLNPVLVGRDTPYETEEGCLSLIGVRKTTRYENIEVEYWDLGWNKRRKSFSGYAAQIIQHELDHLEGILI